MRSYFEIGLLIKHGRAEYAKNFLIILWYTKYDSLLLVYPFCTWRITRRFYFTNNQSYFGNKISLLTCDYYFYRCNIHCVLCISIHLFYVCNIFCMWVQNVETFCALIYDSLSRVPARQFQARFVDFFHALSGGKHVAKRKTGIEKLEGEPIRVCLVMLYRLTDIIFKGTHCTRLHPIFLRNFISETYNFFLRLIRTDMHSNRF